MNFIRFSLLLLIPILLFAFSSTRSFADKPSPSERTIENLSTFARVYGYVRFFSPSNEAIVIDWNRLAILGTERAANAPDDYALSKDLLQIFGPIAPKLVLSDLPEPVPQPTPQAAGMIFWQYQGLNLTQGKSPYHQKRVFSASDKTASLLFSPAEPPPPLRVTLAPRLVLCMPTALPVDADGKQLERSSTDFENLKTALATLETEKLTVDDWRLRVAGIIIVWNAFQHFHPYLEAAGVDWMQTLKPALRDALQANSGQSYRAVLSALVAKTKDGHGFVYGPQEPMEYLPWRVSLVENQIVVTASPEGSPFIKGDIVRSIDGTPALAALHDEESRSPGSPHLSQYRALNQYGWGPAGSSAAVELLRGGASLRETVKREPGQQRYFFSSVSEFTFPGFTELRPGIFYVNLYALSQPEFEKKAPQLATARGIIFDWRYDGKKSVTKETRQIKPHLDILPHLIDSEIKASPMLIPQITRPDRQGWTYKENTWPVKPAAPRFRGKVVFINEPTVVSYGETCMAMIVDYHLARLVGAPTAGCNGNVNFLPLPGGYQVMWTGMDVRKHDRSSFYAEGFAPDIPVVRTLAALKENRDEYLEAALAAMVQP